MAESNRQQIASLWRADRPSLLVLLVLALTVRSAIAIAMTAGFSQDPDSYRLIANNLLDQGVFGLISDEGNVIPTAYRPPLYPLLLALCSVAAGEVTATTVAVLHVMLGGATVVLTLVVARRWGLSAWSWVAALLVMLDPLLLVQSVEVMTETLATLLTVGSLMALTAFWERRNWQSAAVAGIVLGLACLCRPTYLPWLGLVGLTLPWFRGLSRAGLLQTAAFGLAAAITLAPWAVRNQLHGGYPVLGTTHGGYALLWANNPFYYRHLREEGWRRPWDAQQLGPWIGRQRQVIASEMGWNVRAERVGDEGAYAFARETMRENRAMFWRATLVRLVRLWDVLPYQLQQPEPAVRRLLRYAAACWYVAVYLLAAVGIWRLGWLVVQPPWLWGLLLCFTFTAVHGLYWSDPRMRAPLMPLVCLLAAAGTAGELSGRRRA